MTQMMTAAQLGLHIELQSGFDETIVRVTDALKEQGFGVLTTIKVDETLKARIGADFRRYTILGACNPMLAHRALATDLNIGLLLPCNVIVYENDAGAGQSTTVSIVDPLQMLGVVNSPDLQPVADEAGRRLNAVAAALSHA
ncbi:MAG: DUF302 domain-containing protein [Caldilineaceae bacterium]